MRNRYTEQADISPAELQKLRNKYWLIRQENMVIKVINSQSFQQSWSHFRGRGVNGGKASAIPDEQTT